ncbi:MAG: hypothetical protein DSY97_00130 [SAR324 cluster bacterium]|jgi:hypothetical protein|uniref:Uncharacterized protein n=1 Tax=SAR324 cluster bacterium TaxID=2024889 RepID=A0A432GDJ3_9DELT|nr:MAG: hypothetical protein DSY97_00130 [SAR324 cluster bacterium]RTZ84037.1 MAG: hypothetical protein DSY95_06690 [SAR324 cluster bacterium]
MQQLSEKEHFEMLLNSVSLKAGFLPYLVGRLLNGIQNFPECHLRLVDPFLLAIHSHDKVYYEVYN